jgi:hypothetical protein
MGISPAVAIAAIGAAAAAAGTSYSIVSANDAADQADAAAAEQKKQQDKLLAEQKKQSDLAKAQIDNETNAALNLKNRDSAASRAKALAMNAQGRSSTILTGPLGVPNAGGQPGSAPGKTLLGL